MIIISSPYANQAQTMNSEAKEKTLQLIFFQAAFTNWTC